MMTQVMWNCLQCPLSWSIVLWRFSIFGQHLAQPQRVFFWSHVITDVWRIVELKFQTVLYYVVLLWGGVPSELDENQEWSQDWWRDCTMLTNQLATSSTHPRASKSSVSAPKNMNSSSIYPRIGNEYHAGVSPGCIGSSVYTGHFTRASGPLAIASWPGPSNTLSLP